MGLQKQIEINNSGLTVDYWVIGSKNFTNDCVIIEVEGFVSRDARKSGKSPAFRQSIMIGSNDFPSGISWHTASTADLYKTLKLQIEKKAEEKSKQPADNQNLIPSHGLLDNLTESSDVFEE